MSLINKMLTDLEARQHPSSANGPPSHVYHDLHPAAGAGRRSRRVVLPLLVLAVFATTAVFAWDRWAPQGWNEQVLAWGNVVREQVAVRLGVSAAGELRRDPPATADNMIRPAAKTVSPEPPSTQIATSGARAVAAVGPVAKLAEGASNSDTIAAPVKGEPAEAKRKRGTHQTPAGTDIKRSTPTRMASRAPPAYSQEPRQRRAMAGKATGAPAPVKTVTPAPAIGQTPNSPGTGTALQPAVEKKLRALTVEEQAENAYRQGTRHLQQGRLSEAEAALREALKNDARHVKARELLVGMVARRGGLDEAQQLLEEGRKLFPEDYRFAQLLARLHVQRGADAKGLALLEQVQDAAQKDADFLGLLATLYQRAGRHVDAIRAYSRALILKPDQGQWWLALGISFEAEDSSGAAYNAYLRALGVRALDPNLAKYAQQRLAVLRPKVATPVPSKAPAAALGSENQAAN